jgi:hypothetical protein
VRKSALVVDARRSVRESGAPQHQGATRFGWKRVAVTTSEGFRHGAAALGEP